MVRWLAPSVLVALAGAVVLLLWPAGTGSPGGPPGTGEVRYFKAHGPGTDRLFADPNARERRWALSSWYSGRVYSPFFDGGGGVDHANNNEWYPRGYVYANAVALYNGDHPDVATSRPRWNDRDVDPRWILRSERSDRRSAQAFVPFDCGYRGRSGQPMCTQYLADVANPAYRAFFVRRVAALVRRQGYGGVWLDDVNFSDEDPRDPKVNASDGRDGPAGKVWPLYRRTRGEFGEVTLGQWQRGMRLLIEELAAALPADAVIAPNIPIGTIYPGPRANEQLMGAVRAATHVEMERGVTDPCIVGGGSRFGFDSFAAWVDLIHRQGKGVIFDALHDWTPGDPAESCDGAETGGPGAAREFTLGTYLLFDEGLDQVGFTRYDEPGNYWRGWRTDLGTARGPRYRWRGLWRRDFARGTVLVNPPGAPARTVPLRGSRPTLGPRRAALYAAAPESP